MIVLAVRNRVWIISSVAPVEAWFLRYLNTFVHLSSIMSLIDFVRKYIDILTHDLILSHNARSFGWFYCFALEAINKVQLPLLVDAVIEQFLWMLLTTNLFFYGSFSWLKRYYKFSFYWKPYSFRLSIARWININFTVYKYRYVTPKPAQSEEDISEFKSRTNTS